MENDFCYVVPHTEPLSVLSLSGKANSRVFRKQLIYTGQFVKKTEKVNQPFKVDLSHLQHWRDTFLAMSQEGIEIPVPVEHSKNPDDKRGSLLGLEVAKDSRGRDSLYGIIEFHTDKAAEQYKNSNVSIYVPNSRTSNNGTEYKHPIEHVAITDYPVIAGLEKFETLALSEIDTMAIDARKLADKLGVAADVADAELEAAITTAIDALLKQIEKPAPENKQPPAKTEAPAVAASLVGMVKRARNTELQALVAAGKIVPAVAKKLETKYCEDGAISLSLSSGSESDDFETTIEALKLNERVLSLGEKSGQQVLELSAGDTLNPSKNPLLKNAEQRAANAT